MSEKKVEVIADSAVMIDGVLYTSSNKEVVHRHDAASAGKPTGLTREGTKGPALTYGRDVIAREGDKVFVLRPDGSGFEHILLQGTVLRTHGENDREPYQTKPPRKPVQVREAGERALVLHDDDSTEMVPFLREAKPHVSGGKFGTAMDTISEQVRQQQEAPSFPGRYNPDNDHYARMSRQIAENLRAAVEAEAKKLAAEKQTD